MAPSQNACIGAAQEMVPNGSDLERALQQATTEATDTPSLVLTGLRGEVRPSLVSLHQIPLPFAEKNQGGASKKPRHEPAKATFQQKHSHDDARCWNGQNLSTSFQNQFRGQEEPVIDFSEQAREFANKIATNHRRLLMYDRHAPDMNANNFSSMSPDALVGLAIKLFATQDKFRRQGKSIHVDIGYHYTKTECMAKISTEGLLTKDERMVANIASPSNGETFGEGIYTGMNPFSYHKFKGGDQGLFVARIQGQSRVGVGLIQPPDATMASTETLVVDTVIGRQGKTDEVWVLQSSAQSVPLAKFSADLVELDHDASIGNHMVYIYHCCLQQVVDECFNDGVSTPVIKFLPSQVNLRGYGLTRVVTFHQVLEYVAPVTLHGTDVLDLSKEVRPEDIAKGEECSICLSDLSGHEPVIQLGACLHQFHKSCAQEMASQYNKCPNCRAVMGPPRGCMPSGTMQIQVRSDLACKGHEANGTIAITYEIGAGLQKVYHENPGQFHSGAIRSAFIPDCADGRQLLKRLKFAFLHGLTFTVGQSLSTGRCHAVTWASIHHKTRMDRGMHGYPDPCYFTNVNQELDALGVPRADDLVDY